MYALQEQGLNNKYIEDLNPAGYDALTGIQVSIYESNNSTNALSLRAAERLRLRGNPAYCTFVCKFDFEQEKTDDIIISPLQKIFPSPMGERPASRGRERSEVPFNASTQEFLVRVEMKNIHCFTSPTVATKTEFSAPVSSPEKTGEGNSADRRVLWYQ